MSKLDYKLLHALSTVIKQQSFDKAAAELCLTQSAVSQRIKLLEQNVGQPVIIRATPIVATALGKKLLQHYQQVIQLETDLLPAIMLSQPVEKVTINLATNADSLATWLISALKPLIRKYLVEFNLLVLGEEHTIKKLKSGEVFGAISLEQQPLPGCTVTQLGTMKYLLVASRDFIEHYFKQGINSETLKHAPAAIFDHSDDMHIHFIKQHFNLSGGSYPCHTIRSSEAFITFVKQGAAYCLIPELQIEQELKSGELINLLPNTNLIQTLYWHRWVLVKGVYKELSESIINTGQIALTTK